MANQKEKCFDDLQFNRFLENESDAIEESRILAHIATCKQCQGTLEQLAGHEKVWTDIKDHLADAELDFGIAGAETRDGLDQHDQSREMRKLQQLLGPTDNPDMLGRIGSYEVCGLIGRGSAGLVVKALDTQLNRNVAIKLLAPVYSNNGSSRRRFEREGRAIASVRDPNVIPVHTVGEYQGTPYIVMQYVPDGSLQQRIDKNGPLTNMEVVCVGMQVAKGLAAAHKRGIVHRDVKPANVLLESGVDCAMVTDFGLARVVDEATMTRSGAISGTPQFMSPEQARGEAVDPRSDLFSLGSVMYAACTGNSPFRAESVFGVIKRVCDTEPRPIRERNADVPEWLTAFIAKLHAKNVNDRFESAEQVTELLGRELAYMQSPTIVSKPSRDWWVKPKPIPRVDKMEGGKPHEKSGSGWIGIATALLLGAAITFGFSSWNWGGTNSTAPMGFGSMFSLFSKETSEFDKTVQATIDVEEGGTLFFHSDLGTLNVKTHDQPTVEMKLVYTVEAEDEDTANKLFRAMKVKYDVDSKEAKDAGLSKGSDAAIIAKFGTRSMTKAEIENSEDLEELKEQILIRNFRGRRSAKFELNVPQEFSLDVTTFGGAIESENIHGTAKLLTHGGDIELGDVTGTVSVKTHGGHIEVGNVGDEAALYTHGGHIEFGNVDGRLVAHTHGGHITGRRITGPVDANTHGGKVRLIHTGDSVVAKTNGGGVTIAKAEGPVEAIANAGKVAVTFVGQPQGDSVLRANSGSIFVGYTDDIAFDIDAKAGNGRIVAPFSDKKTDSVMYRLNDGKHKLKIVSNNGKITFREVDPGELEEELEQELERVNEAEQAQDAFDRGYDLIVEGKLDESIAANLEAAKFDGLRGVAMYNIGCAWALKGDSDKAFEALDKAVEHGFDSHHQFMNDEDLSSLRDDDRFKGLVEKLNDRTRQSIDMVVRGKEASEAQQSFNRGYDLIVEGEYDASIEANLEAAKYEGLRGIATYNIGCAWALKGDKDEAFKALNHAVTFGFTGLHQYQNDEDLDSLKEDERWAELIVRLKEQSEDDCDCDCEDGECDCEDCDCECDEKCESECDDKDDEDVGETSDDEIE